MSDIILGKVEIPTLDLSYFTNLSENYGDNVGTNIVNYPIDKDDEHFKQKQYIDKSRKVKKEDVEKKINKNIEILEMLYEYCGNKYYCPNLQFVNSKTYVEKLDENFVPIVYVKFEYIEDKINILLQYILFQIHLANYVNLMYAVHGERIEMYKIAKLEKPIIISYSINNILYNLKVNYLLKLDIDNSYIVTVEDAGISVVLNEEYYKEPKKIIEMVVMNQTQGDFNEFGTEQFNLDKLIKFIEAGGNEDYENANTYKEYLTEVFKSEYVIYNNHEGIEKYKRFLII
uniref:Uncharacterized protein n=1 Tax=Pithovirus LCDPAC02 TaxID=2506601 RepID=A0A481YQZ4_9VIRU|nr:MAG: hypothetical protein LCDPAC02_03540 [Pithovirus LCDPAC02]